MVPNLPQPFSLFHPATIFGHRRDLQHSATWPEPVPFRLTFFSAITCFSRSTQRNSGTIEKNHGISLIHFSFLRYQFDNPFKDSYGFPIAAWQPMLDIDGVRCARSAVVALCLVVRKRNECWQIQLFICLFLICASLFIRLCHSSISFDSLNVKVLVYSMWGKFTTNRIVF